MAEKIQHKRSGTPGKKPLPADLVEGELALNTTDGKLFTKLADGRVAELGGVSRAQAHAIALLF